LKVSTNTRFVYVVAVVVGIVSLLASTGPAIRATHTDPSSALRAS
jgi:ABC-type lipoprotein release transport system permease subunit